MQTKNGIELNLAISDYKSVYDDFIFYFSSLFYKRKFDEGLENYIEVENAKLKYKYGINLNGSIFLAIAFYKKIEKRGFYVKTRENIKLTKNLFFSIKPQVY